MWEIPESRPLSPSIPQKDMHLGKAILSRMMYARHWLVTGTLFPA